MVNYSFKPCYLLKKMRLLFKLFLSFIKSVWRQKNLEHTELCSAGAYLSPSTLCVISRLHKENLPGIWMDGSCQRPPGLSASHQSAIHLISSKPLDFKPSMPHDTASPVVILIADVILLLGEKQVKRYWITRVKQHSSKFREFKCRESDGGNSNLVSHNHEYLSLVETSRHLLVR